MVDWKASISEEDLAAGEFDGCAATGFMFGLLFWIPKKGYVHVCKIVHDPVHNVDHLEWNQQLLEELLRRANSSTRKDDGH